MLRYKSPFHIIGLTAAVAGLGILGTPGFKELIFAVLNKAFHLGISLERPSWSGWILLAIGVMLLLYGEIRFNQVANNQPFIAFRHHSLDSYGAQLRLELLGKKYAQAQILQIDCDQTMFFGEGVCDPVSAVRGCLHKVRELTNARNIYPDAPVGYYGLAHTALQFLVGSAVSTQSNVLLFEQDRTNGNWSGLEEHGPSLGLVVGTVNVPEVVQSVVVRIAISYQISDDDILEVVQHPFEEICIALNPPRIDAITAYNQVREVAASFRSVLDNAHARHNNRIPIHVFYAGPACLGFSLGRQINRTIHHPVWVHQYDGSYAPRYRWAVQVTGSGQTEPIVLVQSSKGT